MSLLRISRQPKCAPARLQPPRNDREVKQICGVARGSPYRDHELFVSEEAKSPSTNLPAFRFLAFSSISRPPQARWSLAGSCDNKSNQGSMLKNLRLHHAVCPAQAIQPRHKRLCTIRNGLARGESGWRTPQSFIQLSVATYATSRSKKQKKKTPQKSQKEQEKEDAAAFLEAAAQRTTGGPLSSSSQTPTAQSTATQPPPTPAQPASPRVAQSPPSSGVDGRAQTQARSKRPAAARKENGDQEAVAYMEAALHRVSGGAQNQQPAQSTDNTGARSDPTQNAVERQNDANGNKPSSEEEDLQMDERLRAWFTKFMDRAKNYESLSEMPVRRSPVGPQEGQQRARKSDHRLLQPWRLSARRKLHTMQLAWRPCGIGRVTDRSNQNYP